MQIKKCNHCHSDFEVKDHHLNFYDKISPIFDSVKYQIPTPRRCYLCRMQRRMSHRTYWYITKRKSSYSGKTIFSTYSEDTPFPVYENEEWYSDHWDALSFGRDFDFSRGFFEQFFELRDCVPHRALTIKKVENSDFCNNSIQLKDCYLSQSSVACEGCLYCDGMTASKDCIECAGSVQCELCYAVVNSRSCFNLQNSTSCISCKDSYFLLNCRSCHNCLGCVNLRHKSYCIFNVQYTKEDYDKILAANNLSSFVARKEFSRKFSEFALGYPQPHWTSNLVEDVTGDYIFESGKVENSFFVSKGQNIHFSFGAIENIKDSYDCTSVALTGELLYESLLCAIGIYNLLFCYECIENCKNLIYCALCHGCNDCFGCVGLHQKSFCILNKQYSKEDYHKIIPQIIAKMKQTEEWGEFFPIKYSAFSYNLSLAHYYFPLTKDQCSKNSYSWFDENKLSLPSSEKVQDYLDGLPDSDEAFCYKSEISGSIFRILSHEVKQYRKLSVPLPRENYFERFLKNMKWRGGIKLYKRKCALSGKEIFTTYPPDSPWIIWDKEEYEKNIN